MAALVLLGTIALGAFVAAAYLFWWYQHHPRDSQELTLFDGIRYVREATESPRRIVAHLVFVNLKAPGLAFVVTPPDPAIAPALKAMTVEDFLKTSGAQLAINANFFHPFHSKAPWDFYPRTGDAVEVLGIASSMGDQYSAHSWGGATLYLSESNHAQIGGAVERVWNAVSGDQWLIRSGHIPAETEAGQIYPRAAAGLTKDGAHLILTVVDGKQPGFSEGVTLRELAAILSRHGAYDAINLDGGGSVTLVAAGADGNPIILNSPIHTRIPGRQRPVANHLGIRSGKATPSR